MRHDWVVPKLVILQYDDIIANVEVHKNDTFIMMHNIYFPIMPIYLACIKYNKL